MHQYKVILHLKAAQVLALAVVLQELKFMKIFCTHLLKYEPQKAAVQHLLDASFLSESFPYSS
jgi:hypothetical protein